MKLLPLCITSLLAGAVALTTTGISIADDGEMFRKNVSKNPAEETEHAALSMLPLYVPAQSADDTLLGGIEYYNADGALVETREYVRPLIVHYTEGHVEGIEEEGYGGFPGHGERDAFGSVSLDDGASWKRTNLSNSADSSSIKVRDGRRWVPYPGDVGRSSMASDGNQVLVVWVSRYARGGNPNYAMSDDERALVADWLAADGKITDAADCTDGDLIETPCVYLEDHFSVAGSQGKSDLADEGLPLIGELPYAALWAARGVMLPPVDEGGTSTFVWFKAERLSSAVRDANRPEAKCVKGAGCVVVWQEDPDGIRPGEGEGPGEGWSGAVAHHKTDTWYAYIDWDDFALVAEDDGGYGSLYGGTGYLPDWVAANDTGSPSAAIPMSIPVRLTDNDMCVAVDDKPYCYADFDGSGEVDICYSSVTVTMETPEGPDATVEMCVAEDGRLMRGNTASTRPRPGLHGYSSTCVYDPVNPDTCPIDSAWFYMAYEENKGLGEEEVDAGLITADDPTEYTKVDMGKNIWYHTFDMFNPELVSQGMMLNQPAVYEDGFVPVGSLVADSSLGYNFMLIEPDPIYETQAGLESTLYQAEISRRASPISQDWYYRGPSNTVALQLWKQGIIRRGGPADIMGRLFAVPTVNTDDCDTVYEWCDTAFEECTTTYEQCDTTYEWCVTTVECVDNQPNPAYDYNPGKCRKDPTLERCFEFIDPDGNLTNEPQTCDETTSCGSVDYCDSAQDGCTATTTCNPIGWCDESEEGCSSETTCGPVDWCDVAEDGCTSAMECGPIDQCDVGDDRCIATDICPTEFDLTTDNPYGYANMVCEDADGNAVDLAFADGTNPRYVKGFCPEPAINMSAGTILLGEGCADAATCLELFPFNDYFDDLEGGLPIPKIFEWQQLGPDFGETESDTALTNFDDKSWENPYDVAKGHRGFMSGDMIMAMYAWSANWKQLTDAHAVFNLYNRRSFDGGRTWTTTPTDWEHGVVEVTWTADGTTTCEWMEPETCDGESADSGECAVCTTYAAGDFEQARNVSQLTGHLVTVLDPRYSPTTSSISDISVGTLSLPAGFTAPAYEDDTRDPSRYFMVYETGLNSAYDAGEAEPLDLFYSRAIDWGDEYLVLSDDPALCIPVIETVLDFCNEFDALEGSQFAESGEASVSASPGGQFFYAAWNQVDFGADGEDHESDAWLRRVLFLDDYVPADTDTTTQ